MSFAYQIRAGQVRRISIPARGLTIPTPGAISEADRVRALPGTEPEHWQGHTLAVVRRIATRLTPWATWWLAPATGRDEHAGEAHCYRDMVVLKLDMTRRYAVSTAFHEAWHIAEQYLDASEIEAVNLSLSSGHDWRDDYYGSAVERRANAFADWAMLALETGRPLMDRRRPETVAFHLVYSGGLGLRMARRGLIPKRLMTLKLAAAAAVPERRAPAELAAAAGVAAAVVGGVWAATPFLPVIAPWAVLATMAAASVWALLPERTADSN